MLFLFLFSSQVTTHIGKKIQKNVQLREAKKQWFLKNFPMELQSEEKFFQTLILAIATHTHIVFCTILPFLSHIEQLNLKKKS